MGVQIIIEEAKKLPAIGCVIDGGGLVVTTGDKRAPVTVVGDCTLTGWRIIGDATGSVVLDIYRSAGVGQYPTVDSIVDANPPLVDNAISSESSDVSAWCGGTAELNDGDILEFSVLSISNFRQIRVELFREAR